MSILKSYDTQSKWRASGVLIALALLVYAPCKADVPAAAPPPAPPAGSYCASMYNELYNDMQAFNNTLATPPAWTPIPGGPTIYAGNLQWANGNTGPSISSSDYMQSTVQPQLQALQALGVQAILVPVLFPILYEPFYGSQAAFQPYLTFYTQVAQAVRAAGLKLIVDNEILFSNDTAAGWTNMNAFYGPLTWTEYVAARAQMAATIEQYMQPDYLMLANEPDTEAIQTGQTNLNNPEDAAAMVQAEITAVQSYLATATVSPYPKLGGGFGSWMSLSGSSSLMGYINAYTALPLDYIDFHMLPVNTVQNDNFLANTITIASMAAAVGKPVAISQAWLEDETAEEVNVLNIDIVRARGPFSFWAPLNQYFLQMAQNLASYTNMIYLAPQFPVYLFAQQTYGGTDANGGAANCTCTTTSCSDYEIMQIENQLATTADQQSVFTTTAANFYGQLVTTPDTAPPTTPGTPAGSPGTTGVKLTWTASADNVGVAGYNVYRCSPPAEGQACTGVWIANSTLASFMDSTLASNTPYNYQVSAFDFANNESPLSPTLSLQTFRTSADSATNLAASVVSAQEIDLNWAAPSDTTGLSSYQIYGGTSPGNLQQIAVRAAGTTTYKNLLLQAATTYYYGIVAVEEGISAPMSTVVSATSLPLPTPPSNVAGTATATTIALTWQEAVQPGGLPISGYQVYEGTTPGNMGKAVSVSGAKYTATALAPNTTYYFEVVAMDTGHDNSALSDAIAVTTFALPAAPAGVTATANSAKQVTVSWSESTPANGMPVSNYAIFRGASPTTMTQVASKTTTQFIDTTCSPNTTYYYALEAIDTGKDVSAMSATVQATTFSLPTAPVNVAPMANSATKVTITWSEDIPSNGLPMLSYAIFRGPSSGALTQLAVRTSPTYIDTTASASTTYYYAVQATDTGKDVSPMSAAAPVTTPPMPAAPSNVVATANGATETTITWSEIIPPNGLPIQNYNIYRGPSSTNLTKLTARTGTSFIDTGVVAGTTYYYAIVAVDTGSDSSPMSATAVVTTPY